MTIDHAGSHHIANPVIQQMQAGCLFADATSCSRQFNRENTDYLAYACFSERSSVQTAVLLLFNWPFSSSAKDLYRNLHKRTEFQTETSIGAASIYS